MLIDTCCQRAICPPPRVSPPSEILQKANPSFTSARFPESLCLTDRSSSRDYGFLVVFAQSDEPELWSPLFTIPTLLLRSSQDQRSGGTLPACILETLADQAPPPWGGDGSLGKGGQSCCFSCPPPIPSCRRTAWESGGGGVANSAVGGEVLPRQAASSARSGIKFQHFSDGNKLASLLLVLAFWDHYRLVRIYRLPVSHWLCPSPRAENSLRGRSP